MDAVRVTWLCTPLTARGGVTATLLRWATHLDRDRFAIRLVGDASDAAGVRRTFAGVPHLELALVPAVWGRRGLSSLGQLAETIGAPDVVHTVKIQADIAGALALWRTRVPVVSSVQGRLVRARSPLAKRLAYSALYAVARHRIDRFIAISEATRRELVAEFGVPPDRVEVVLPGLEPARPDVPPRERHSEPCVGFVGELIHEKGADVFLRAAALVARSEPRARFVVSGDGEERAALEALARSLRLGDRVTFRGWVDDPHADIDVLVFSSRPHYDGLPNVILEAFRAGIPVVATAVAGVPELIRDEVDGSLVASGDAPAIAAAVAALLGDETLWRQRSDASQRRSRDFPAESEVRGYANVYERLASRSAS